MVEAMLAATPEVAFGRVVVQARQGHVTVSGVLDSDIERTTVERIVRQSPGVRDMTSELTLLPSHMRGGV